VIGADVNKENVSLTFDEIRKELRRLRTEEISDSELETARNHFIGSLQSEISTPFAHADKIKTITLYNLRRDHYQNMITKMEALTPEAIAAISHRYFDENLFFEVAVG
jgi:predicted Zn-dependent peptidase